MRGDEIERNVEDVLHDLIDDNNDEPGDRLANLDTLILQPVDRELDTPAAPGVMDFRTAALGRGVNRRDLDDIPHLNGIPTGPRRAEATANPHGSGPSGLRTQALDAGLLNPLPTIR